MTDRQASTPAEGEEPCWECGGSGVDDRDFSDCRACAGTGLVYTEQAIRDQLAVEEEHRDD